MTSRRRAFAAVIGVGLAGQVATVAYEVVVAGRFGTRVEADALALSLTLAVAVGNELVVWVSTLFIPNYVDVRTHAGEAAATRFSHRTLVTLVAMTALAAALLALAATPLVALLAPALPRVLGSRLLRLFAPLIVLLPAATLLTGVLQARERFVTAGLRQLFWYGAALAAVLALPDALGPAAVPLGMGAGLAVFSGVLLVVAHAPTGGGGARTDLGPWLARMGRAVLPLALASGANYANVAYERSIAARLPEGSLAALTYAFRLLNFPLTLILANATTMLFPPLARHAARRDATALASLLGRALRLAIIFGAPLAALALALAEPAIRVLLERGAFTAESTRLTATALAWYAPGVIGIAGAHVLARAYQALHAIRAMVAVGIAIVALNLVMMPVFTAVLGLRGLALAISISGLGLFVLLLVVLERRLPELGAGALLRWALRPLLAALVAWGIATAAAGAAGGSFAALATGGLAGGVAYALALFALAPSDARLALELLLPTAERWLPEPR